MVILTGKEKGQQIPGPNNVGLIKTKPLKICIFLSFLADYASKCFILHRLKSKEMAFYMKHEW